MGKVVDRASVPTLTDGSIIQPAPVLDTLEGHIMNLKSAEVLDGSTREGFTGALVPQSESHVKKPSNLVTSWSRSSAVRVAVDVHPKHVTAAKRTGENFSSSQPSSIGSKRQKIMPPADAVRQYICVWLSKSKLL